MSTFMLRLGNSGLGRFGPHERLVGKCQRDVSRKVYSKLSDPTYRSHELHLVGAWSPYAHCRARAILAYQ